MIHRTDYVSNPGHPTPRHLSALTDALIARAARAAVPLGRDLAQALADEALQFTGGTVEGVVTVSSSASEEQVQRASDLALDQLAERMRVDGVGARTRPWRDDEDVPEGGYRVVRWRVAVLPLIARRAPRHAR